jgi:hypothetical protein
MKKRYPNQLLVLQKEKKKHEKDLERKRNGLNLEMDSIKGFKKDALKWRKHLLQEFLNGTNFLPKYRIYKRMMEIKYIERVSEVNFAEHFERINLIEKNIIEPIWEILEQMTRRLNKRYARFANKKIPEDLEQKLLELYDFFKKLGLKVPEVKEFRKELHGAMSNPFYMLLGDKKRFFERFEYLMENNFLFLFKDFLKQKDNEFSFKLLRLIDLGGLFIEGSSKKVWINYFNFDKDNYDILIHEVLHYLLISSGIQEKYVSNIKYKAAIGSKDSKRLELISEIESERNTDFFTFLFMITLNPKLFDILKQNLKKNRDVLMPSIIGKDYNKLNEFKYQLGEFLAISLVNHIGIEETREELKKLLKSPEYLEKVIQRQISIEKIKFKDPDLL